MSTLSGTIYPHLLKPSGGNATERESRESERPYELHIDTGYLEASVVGPPTTHSISGSDSEGSVFVGLPLTVCNSTSVRIYQAGEAGSPEAGHFIRMDWGDEKVTFSADLLGIRTCYFTQVGKSIHFSTDLSELCRRTNKTTIQQSVFASHWLGINQLSHECLIGGIERIAPGETITITSKGIARAHVGSDSSIEPQENFLDALIPFLNFSERRTSLGLSGGLDSRTLLSLLVSNGVNFQLHSFGESDHPDNRLAATIARSLGIERVTLPNSSHTGDLAMAQMRQFASSHCAIAPASGGLRLLQYQSLMESGTAVIDGGFGEIGRARFARRLRHPAMKVATFVTAKHLYRAFRFHRASPFNGSVCRNLEEAYTQTIKTIRAQMLADDGVWDNVVDRLMIKYRLPNFYAYGQTAIDQVCIGWMPFAQPVYLDAVLRSPVKYRRRGASYRAAINTANLGLDRFPLAKGFQITPFDKSVSVKSEPMSSSPLVAVEPEVRELVRSSVVRQFDWYDVSRLTKTVDAFFDGDTTLEAEVDWWLSFELWRQSLRS